MPTYGQLLLLIAPVFLIFGIGTLLRRVRWVLPEAEPSFLKILVSFFYPCFILKTVLGNPILKDSSHVVLPPFVAVITVSTGLIVAFYAGKLLGLRVGTGLRTFAFAAGIYNYGFIPIPLMERLFGHESVGVLLVHNLGCELAIWSVGLLMLSGASLKEGWKRLANPTLITLVIALAINAVGWTPPKFVTTTVDALAVCAIPFGLLLSGASVEPFLDRPRELVNWRNVIGACLIRFAIMPVLFLLLARFAPLPVELKRVIVVQAAMPAAMIPLVIARHYGGQPLVAAQVIIGTTLVGVLAIPAWLRLGLAWVGL